MKDYELIGSDLLKDLIRRNKKPYDLGKMAVCSFAVVPFILLVVVVSKGNNFKNNTEMYPIILFLGISLFITVAASSFLLYLKYSENNLFISKNKKIDDKYSLTKKVCFVTLDVLQEDKLITDEKVSYIKVDSNGASGPELKILYSNGEEHNVEVKNIRFFYDITEKKFEKLGSYLNVPKGNYGRLAFSFELGKHSLFYKNEESINNFMLTELEIGSYSSVIIKGNTIATKRKRGKSHINASEYFKAEYLNIIMDMDKDLIYTSGDKFKDKISDNPKILLPLIIMLSSNNDIRSDGVSPLELRMMKKEIKSLFSIKDIIKIDNIAQLAYHGTSRAKGKVLDALKKNVIGHSLKIIGRKITPNEYDKMLEEFCEVFGEESPNGQINTVISYSQKIVGRLIGEILGSTSNNSYVSRSNKVVEANASDIVYYSKFEKKFLEQEEVTDVEKLYNGAPYLNPL